MRSIEDVINEMTDEQRAAIQLLISSGQAPELKHYGVKGMKWGVRRVKKAIVDFSKGFTSEIRKQYREALNEELKKKKVTRQDEMLFRTQMNNFVVSEQNRIFNEQNRIFMQQHLQGF